VVSDNSSRLMSLSACHACVLQTNSPLEGLWFKRKDMYRHTWICNDGRPERSRTPSSPTTGPFAQSYSIAVRKLLPTQLDHRRLVAEAVLCPFVKTKHPLVPRLDTATCKLATDQALADNYNVWQSVMLLMHLVTCQQIHEKPGRRPDTPSSLPPQIRAKQTFTTPSMAHH